MKIPNRKYFSLLCATTLLIHAFSGKTSGGSVQHSVDRRSLERFWLDIYNSTSCFQNGKPTPSSSHELLAKAQPDECYNGVGNPYLPGPPWTGGVPKVNQAYVFSLTKSGHDLWFGTVANPLCLAMSLLNMTGQKPTSFETACMVCEFEKSQYPTQLSPDLGDWRPPEIWLYDTQEKTLINKTPDDLLIFDTVGIRSAGTLGKIVLLGGLSLTKGINLFAFNAETKKYLGSTHLPIYSDIRKWLVANNILYTAVMNTTGGGSVLRWRGNLSNPFQFEVVGKLDNEGAELAYHEGRLFITTWPVLTQSIASISSSGLFMSPSIPPQGLTAAHANKWECVWTADNYEPDPITALSYAGGALASFDGYLWWGTFHVPFASTVAHLVYYNPQDLLSTFLGTYRPLTIFRGRHFDAGGGEIDLVYGLSRLPKYTPNNPFNPTSGGKWEIVPNAMGKEPLWGPSGFCNFFNNYTWSMAVYNNQLYIGTMDWSHLLDHVVQDLMKIFQMDYMQNEIQLPPRSYGADLFRIPDSDSPAIPEYIDGVGNYTNYGIRTMVADDALYLGMANPMNLLTDRNDTLPEGGWELIRLHQNPDHVDDEKILPQEYTLSQNYPNPFNPQTRIPYSLPTTCFVTMDVYDINGKLVRNLVAETKPAGSYQAVWNGDNNANEKVASGLYLYLMKTKSFTKSGKMLFLK